MKYIIYILHVYTYNFFSVMLFKTNYSFYLYKPEEWKNAATINKQNERQQYIRFNIDL